MPLIRMAGMIGSISRTTGAARALMCAAALLTVIATPVAGPNPDYGRIELILDTWGIPHIFSSTDLGAMYGLGYATAEQRGFQMTYALRIMKGRLAEIIGEQRRAGNQESALDRDRKMRTFGWARAAARTAAGLDAGTLAMLKAYCEGVNDSFAAQKQANRLHPLFARLGVETEAWTPADCLLSWWHLGQFFATDGTRDLIAWRNSNNPPPGQMAPPRPTEQWQDDTTAVVQREDVSVEWLRRVQAFAAKAGIAGRTSDPSEGPKFSHAWVGGARARPRARPCW